MNCYKLTISYDGTDYCGWLSQPNKRSVASTLRTNFARVFKVPMALTGASKTDAGVHALGQVARVKTALKVSPEQLVFAWNNVLPPTIIIRSFEHIAANFHPRINVLSKTYYYHFFLNRPLPYVHRYGWHYVYPVDLDKLAQALRQFIGQHDFRSYCTGNEMKSTIRSIDSINLEYLRRYDAYRIAVRGPSFLRHMIRRVVGAALYVARHKELSIDFLTEVMHNKDPNNILPTAPAQGLLLRKIVYKR